MPPLSTSARQICLFPSSLEQPRAASDFNSLDTRTSNIDSSAYEAGISAVLGSLREPATGDASGAARQAKDGLSGIPNDAVIRDQKGHTGLEQTTGKEYVYPRKAEPSSGIKI